MIGTRVNSVEPYSAQQVQRRQARNPRHTDTQLQRQSRHIADVLNRQAGVVDQQISVTRRLLVDGRQAHQRMTVLFKFQRQVGQGLALSNEQNVETSHDVLLVKPGSR